MINSNPNQTARYHLARWGYFERNVQKLDKHPKIAALSLFKALKRMEPVEINYLAERYYKSKSRGNYDEYLDDYRTSKAVEYKIIAEKFKRSENAVQVELKRIERKLGTYIQQCKADIAWEEARNDIEKLESLTLSKLDNVEERTILAKAFREIELLRSKS